MSTSSYNYCFTELQYIYIYNVYSSNVKHRSTSVELYYTTRTGTVRISSLEVQLMRRARRRYNGYYAVVGVAFKSTFVNLHDFWTRRALYARARVSTVVRVHNTGSRCFVADSIFIVRVSVRRLLIEPQQCAYNTLHHVRFCRYIS